MDGFVVSPSGEQQAGPSEVYQDGLLGHLVGLIRAQLSVPHADVEGEQGGENPEGPWEDSLTLSGA
eukprot:9534063-Prorocentrum_lima.AAC.1